MHTRVHDGSAAGLHCEDLWDNTVGAISGVTCNPCRRPAHHKATAPRVHANTSGRLFDCRDYPAGTGGLAPLARTPTCQSSTHRMLVVDMHGDPSAQCIQQSRCQFHITGSRQVVLRVGTERDDLG